MIGSYQNDRILSIKIAIVVDTCNVSCYICAMIINYKHKGLELYALRGDRSKLQQHHVQKIKTILSRLDVIKNIQEMNQPGYYLHQLGGDLSDYYSIRVSGNYRIIFRFEDGNVYDVDYLDYH